jgi:hypothetical protein
MAKELDAILDHGEANHAASCKTESGSVSFLEQIICPIYETMKSVSGSCYNSHNFNVSYVILFAESKNHLNILSTIRILIN